MELFKEFRFPERSPDTIHSICSVVSSSSPVIAAAGGKRIQLLSANSLSPLSVIGGHGVVKSIATSSNEPNLLWSATDDWAVRGWDVRTPEAPVTTFTVKNNVGSLSSIATSGATGHVAAGTEAIKIEGENSASVILWDVRGGKPVVEYDEVHSDTVTKLCFSPHTPNYLCSGSLDGLTCILDISVVDLDDSLESVLNVESSVAQAGFFGPASEYVYSVSLTETVGFWMIDDAMRLGLLENNRESLDKKYGIPMDYIVDCFYQTSGLEQLTTVAGSHSGKLHLLNVKLDGLELSSTLPHNHQTTVRCLDYDAQNHILYTGDEDGRLCCWKSSSTCATVSSSETTTVASITEAAEGTSLAAEKRLPAKKEPGRNAGNGTSATSESDHPAQHQHQSGDASAAHSSGRRQHKHDRQYKPY